MVGGVSAGACNRMAISRHYVMTAELLIIYSTVWDRREAQRSALITLGTSRKY